MIKGSRRHPEDTEEPYRMDVERILRSKAYVRYADKTQVVYLFPHDHISYRGLHVQLVSMLARSIGRKLGLNLDLIEAISLGHDMGHAPFGHEGEEYLSLLSQEASLGAFTHSLQSCRVASEIENLNLTLATLDGFLCHDGAMRSRFVTLGKEKTWDLHEKEKELRRSQQECDIYPGTEEAALVKIADTVSYLERDMEDACTIGLIKSHEIPKTILSESISQAVVKDIVSVYNETHKIGISQEVFEALNTIRTFNFDRIYFHDCLKTESKKIQNAYQLIFSYLLKDFRENGTQSTLWKHFLHNKDQCYIEKYQAAQHVVDYIAGMTDGYFLRFFQSIFMPRTIEVPDVLPFS
jgi:dGTPase